MADLGRSVDELDVDLLGLPTLDGGEDGLSESDGSLAGADDTALDEDVVFVDLTVVGEATERGDVLDDGISLGRGVVVHTVDGAGTDPVDLLVHPRSNAWPNNPSDIAFDPIGIGHFRGSRESHVRAVRDQYIQPAPTAKHDE